MAYFDDYKNGDEILREDGEAKKKARKLLYELEPEVVHAFWDINLNAWAGHTQAATKIPAIIFSKWRDRHPGENPGEKLLPSLQRDLNDIGVKINFGTETETEEGVSLQAQLHLDDEQSLFAKLDFVRDSLAESTEYLMEFIVICAHEWARRHPDGNVMTDILLPASKILGDALGFGILSVDPGGMNREKAEKIRDYIERVKRGDEDGKADE